MEYEISEISSKVPKKEKKTIVNLKSLSFISEEIKNEAINIAMDINIIKRGKIQKKQFIFFCIIEAYKKLGLNYDIDFISKSLDVDRKSYKTILGRIMTDNGVNCDFQEKDEPYEVFYNEIDNYIKKLKMKQIVKSEIVKIFNELIAKNKIFLNDKPDILICAIFGYYFFTIQLDELSFLKEIKKTIKPIKEKIIQIKECLLT